MKVAGRHIQPATTDLMCLLESTLQCGGEIGCRRRGHSTLWSQDEPTLAGTPPCSVGSPGAPVRWCGVQGSSVAQRWWPSLKRRFAGGNEILRQAPPTPDLSTPCLAHGATCLEHTAWRWTRVLARVRSSSNPTSAATMPDMRVAAMAGPRKSRVCRDRTHTVRDPPDRPEIHPDNPEEIHRRQPA